MRLGEAGLAGGGLGILVCAALPWFSINCAGQPLASQTGYEAATGDITVSPAFKAAVESLGAGEGETGKNKESPKAEKKEGDGPKILIPALFGLAAAALAGIIGLIGLASEGASRPTAGLVAFVAAVGITWAAIAGTPMKEGEDQKETAKIESVIRVEREPAMWGALLLAWGQVLAAAAIGRRREKSFPDWHSRE